MKLKIRLTLAVDGIKYTHWLAIWDGRANKTFPASPETTKMPRPKLLANCLDLFGFLHSFHFHYTWFFLPLFLFDYFLFNFCNQNDARLTGFR